MGGQSEGGGAGADPGGGGGQAGATSEAGSGGAVEEPPGVRVVGRTTEGSNGSVRFAWSGTHFRARFTGTQVSMELKDGNNQNRFTVVIDDREPKTVTSSSGSSSLALASGLEEGTHELLVWRNTEAAMGVSEFLGLSGFSANGELLAPPKAPNRRVELIGDSLSAGAGDEGTSTSCSPSIDAFTNDYLAYGSVAARAVGADLVTIAWSGIGVYRSYSASDPTMPERYPYAIPNDQSEWDFSRYRPDVVVINLGTNDFGQGNPGQPYVDAYVAFAEEVHEHYPDAPVILIDMYGGERAAAIESVISGLGGSGIPSVEMLSFSSVPNNNTACNQHPNVTAHQAMGELLAAHLQSLMGW